MKKVYNKVMKENSRGFVPILIMVVVVVAVVAYLGKGSSNLGIEVGGPKGSASATASPNLVTTAQDNEKGTPKAQVVNGVELKDIKYTLPEGWKAYMNTSSSNQVSLMLSTEGGGYLGISVYSYPGNIGRREYYCQVRKQERGGDVCISSSYFTEMTIGNISGYKAEAIDNSGGGSEYFGAKGNKFYIISSFSGPLPGSANFVNNYRLVLSSLVF